jgi:hypothetical protein
MSGYATYRELTHFGDNECLKELSEYLVAIMVDLGQTFPTQWMSHQK